MNSKQATFIKSAKLIDGTGADPKINMGVIVSDGIIQDIIPQGQITDTSYFNVIDLGNWTMMPGMIDAHTHFFGVESNQLYQLVTESEAYRALRAAGEAKKMLEAGITAARCLGSSISPHLRRAFNEHLLLGPRIVAAGREICSTDGTWDHINLPLDWVRNQDLLADGVDAMRDIVRRRIRQGADVIKIGLSKGGFNDKYHVWGDDPYQQIESYSLEEIDALVQEAHRNKLKVSAHCIGDGPVRMALKGGIDVIEHGYGISEDTRKMLVDQNALLVSTICQLYYHELAGEPYHYPDWQKAVFRRHLEVMQIDFEKSLAAGVKYALGTDLIGDPTHPHHLAPKEFELAVAWGMSPMQAIVAGTKISAEALGLERSIGTIEKFKLADIIAMDGDPTIDITALQRVSFVMLGGEIVTHKKSPIQEISTN